MLKYEYMGLQTVKDAIPKKNRQSGKRAGLTKKMKSIYRSEEGKKRILALYEAQLSRLTLPYRDIYVNTSFGKTHLIETGNFEIRRAKRIIPNCKTCLLSGRGHMHFLTDEEKKMIVVFLKKK